MERSSEKEMMMRKAMAVAGCVARETERKSPIHNGRTRRDLQDLVVETSSKMSRTMIVIGDWLWCDTR